MSRGHGSVQSEVLRQWAGKTVSVNQVLWSFVQNGDLEKKVEVSVRRALDTLAKDGEVTIEKRLLASAEEVVDHYPWRTSAASVKDMRQRLLPHVAEYKPDKSFTTADNEDFDMRGDPARRDAARKGWVRVEKALLQELGPASVPVRREIVALLARGYDLFEGSLGISSSRGFTGLVALTASQLSKPVGEMLETFASEAFPQERAKRLRLQSWIGARISMPSTGEVAVDPDLLTFLWDREHAYISSAHGGKWVGPANWGLGKVVAPALNKLLRRDALWPMAFVTVPDPST